MTVRLIATLFLFAASGCVEPPVYRFRTNVPWPDQWASGPRYPEYTDMALAADTAAWHRQTDMEQLAQEVRHAATRYRGSLLMTRISFADRQTNPGQARQALAFLEVRVTAWPLPATRDTAKRDWSFDNIPLCEAAARCAERMGTALAFPENVDFYTAVRLSAPQMNAAEALALLLLQQDLYLAPTCLGTSVVRSYEHRDRLRFLTAVRRRLAEAAAAHPAGPYTVLPLEDWCAYHSAALRRVIDVPSLTASDQDQVPEYLIREARQYLRRMLELRLTQK
ncbi:MAG: hypothetical protein JSU68_11090 [Phycisphaerales bacterium]|nr:MAG: hypothetical protein JSU68_11090 [Phycisphaerales bacterium]